MSGKGQNLYAAETAILLRGQIEPIAGWVERWDTRRVAGQVAMIIIGTGLYGAAMGCWRDPRQALFVAIKFPLIILLTVAGNGLINGMFAPLLGLNVRFRQSFSAILMSFVTASAILGAFSPLIAFLTWNVPPMSSHVNGAVYSFIKLMHVAAITFAGITGNARLFQLLTRLAGNRAVAWRVMLAWLAINLFLGGQLSWILRPFIGSPDLPVEFLRATAFQGNFYESVFQSVRQIFENFVDD